MLLTIYKKKKARTKDQKVRVVTQINRHTLAQNSLTKRMTKSPGLRTLQHWQVYTVMVPKRTYSNLLR